MSLPAGGPLELGPPPADGIGPLRDGSVVRREWPDGARLQMVAPRPFLCVLRPRDALPLLRELVASQASYLVCPPATRSGDFDPVLRVAPILTALRQRFDQVLLVEVWEGVAPATLSLPLEPAFCVVGAPADVPDDILRAMRRSLRKVRMGELGAVVEHAEDVFDDEPGDLDRETLRRLARGLEGVWWMGIDVRPIYRLQDGTLFPGVLAELEAGFARALLHTLTVFAPRAGLEVPHPFALGRTTVAEPDWEVDQHLAEVAASFDFLLDLTPVNVREAWHQFRRDRFERPPPLYYRPLAVDPEVCKRTLYNVPIEHVEDPTLAPLLREKQEELDRKITMLSDRNTRSFLYESLQLYGGVPDKLHGLAHKLLLRLPATDGGATEESLAAATQMARVARREIERYRAAHPGFCATVETRSDLAAGMMVSGARLLISSHHQVRRSELDALMQHEVGTHLLTYFNARQQPFRQLESGLAGYEAVQEGLAVVAEYLAGGLSCQRLRTLAGRVIACRAATERADLVEVFRLLHREYGFPSQQAFGLAVRALRGGGLTKDALYLRGLVQVLRYLGAGGDLTPLLAGKIHLRHVPAIEELRLRTILYAPAIQPAYLRRPDAQRRLAVLRRGASVLQLAKEATP